MAASPFGSDITAAFSQTLNSAIRYLPTLFAAAFLLVLGWFIATAARWAAGKLVIAAGRLVPAKFRMKDSLARGLIPTSRIVGNVIFWIILLTFLTAAAKKLGLTVLSEWLTGLATYVPRFLAALLIAIIGWQLGVFLNQLVLEAATKTQKLYAPLVGTLAQWTVVLITAFIAIQHLGVDVSLIHGLALLVIGTCVGALALAFSLAAKTVVSNILGSYQLQKTYRPGQRIRIESFEGEILQITATEVILRTGEGQVSVPAIKFSQEASVLISGE